MEISQGTYEMLNDLLKASFNMNARSDSIAYSLSYHYFDHMSNVYHSRWAHYWPQLADEISDEILKYDALPVRKGLEEYTYNSDSLTALFECNNEGIKELRILIAKGIETADYEEDTGIRIFLENLYEKLGDYEKQARRWLNISKTVSSDQMNVHFEEYTFLPIS